MGWELSRLHWAGKLAVTAFLCSVGVGFIFSTLQIGTHHGGMGYRHVVADYYGEPALRDSLDAYWAGVKEDLLQRYRVGREARSSDSSPGDSADEYKSLLGNARSEGHLERLVDEKHRRDLMVQLGIPSVQQLVSLAHTHTFGHAAFLFPVSLLVLLTGLPWKWKGIIAALPHLGVILDYPSAIATRLVAPEFALLLMLAGALMGLGYLIGFVVALSDMWFKRWRTDA